MSLMLVNPRKRKSRTARSPAQRAATKRMLAANRARRGGVSKTRVKRRRNPIGLSRVRHAVSHRRSARRRNPISTGGIGGMLMNSLKGAGGAIIINAATNYLPDAVKAGKLVYATRAVLAIALGTFGRKMLGGNARVMAEGALVVNFHDAINSVAGTMLPGSALHGVGEYINQTPALPQAQPAGRFDSELSGTGEYIYR